MDFGCTLIFWSRNKHDPPDQPFDRWAGDPPRFFPKYGANGLVIIRLFLALCCSADSRWLAGGPPWCEETVLSLLRNLVCGVRLDGRRFWFLVVAGSSSCSRNRASGHLSRKYSCYRFLFYGQATGNGCCVIFNWEPFRIDRVTCHRGLADQQLGMESFFSRDRFSPNDLALGLASVFCAISRADIFEQLSRSCADDLQTRSQPFNARSPSKSQCVGYLSGLLCV